MDCEPFPGEVRSAGEAEPSVFNSSIAIIRVVRSWLNSSVEAALLIKQTYHFLAVRFTQTQKWVGA